MKKLILALILATLSFSCSDDDNSSSGGSLSNTPMAKEEYNNSNYGVYKGVFVGSTGNVLININNDGTLSAKIVIDGKTYNFTTEETVELEETTSITFTNTRGDSFDFYVNYDGAYPDISNISIEGHPDAYIYVIKEQSDQLVKCFQGTAKQGNQLVATFNLIISGDEVHGIAKSSNSGSSDLLMGSIEGNQISGHVVDDEVTFIGTVNGNNANGTWIHHGDQEEGTWSGKRKL